MRRMRHSPLGDQVERLNQMLRGHYAYYGIAGNIRALRKVHPAVKCYCAQNAKQPELARQGLVDAIPADPRNGSRCCDPSCLYPTATCKL